MWKILVNMMLAEEGFNNSVDKIAHLWIVSAFPQPSVPLLNGPMNKMVMVAEMEIIHELNNMNFHSSRLT